MWTCASSSRCRSCLQAHHTVWRKLRQRAGKLVRTTKYLGGVFTPHTHSPNSSGIETEAPRPSVALVRVQPASLTSESSRQRTGFNTAIFIALHLCFGKSRARRQSAVCAVQDVSSSSRRTNCCFSELDIKGPSRQDFFFKNPSRFKALILETFTSQIDAVESSAVWEKPSFTRAQKQKHKFLKSKLGCELILDGAI